MATRKSDAFLSECHKLHPLPHNFVQHMSYIRKHADLLLSREAIHISYNSPLQRRNVCARC